jgi:hypothetical protein
MDLPVPLRLPKPFTFWCVRPLVPPAFNVYGLADSAPSGVRFAPFKSAQIGADRYLPWSQHPAIYSFQPSPASPLATHRPFTQKYGAIITNIIPKAVAKNPYAFQGHQSDYEY